MAHQFLKTGRLAAGMVLAALLLSLPVSAGVYTVTSTTVGAGAEDIPGTLPWALEQVNAGDGPHVINFGISATFTGTALNIWRDDVTVDGTTAPGGPHSVVLDSMPVVIMRDNITIRGLTIINTSLPVTILSGMSGTVIVDNHIGVSVDGTTAWGTNEYGIDVGYSYGPADDIRIDSNVISINVPQVSMFQSAINVQRNTSGIYIRHNKIGTDAAGMTLLGGAQYGIRIVEGISTWIEGNVIGGHNYQGIYADRAESLFIRHNRIGVDAAGTGVLGNLGNGIYAYADGTADGTVLQVVGNQIGGNGSSGLSSVFYDDITIDSNLVGVDADSHATLGNSGSGISLTYYGDTGTPRSVSYNVVGANTGRGLSLYAYGDSFVCVGNRVFSNGDGIGLMTRGARIEDNTVYGNDGYGLKASEVESCVFLRNRFGAGPDGYTADHNGEWGLFLDSCTYNVIGTPGDGNQFADGLYLYQSDSNLVRGNLAGLDADGDSALGSDSCGIRADSSARNTIARNTVSGNGNHGILLYDCRHNRLTANTVGLDSAGGASVPNRGCGIVIAGGKGNLVGYAAGFPDSGGTVVGGNDSCGIVVDGSDSTLINQDVYVGIDRTAQDAVHNSGPGVLLRGGSRVTSIGTGSGPGNVIADGIVVLDCDSTVVSGNRIGVADTAAGTWVARDTTDGVRAVGTTRLRIEDNLIAVSDGDGISIRNISLARVLDNRVMAAPGGYGHGIRISGGDSAAVTANICTGADTAGVYLCSTFTASVRGNTLTGNRDGIRLNRGGLSVMDGNTVRDNDSCGVFLYGSDSVTVTGNTVTGNGTGIFVTDIAWGFPVDATAGNLLEKNTVTDNAGNGVTVYGPDADGNRITENVIYGNGLLGIDLEGDGISYNDATDADGGANEGMNFPVITQTTVIGSDRFQVEGRAPALTRVEVFWAGSAQDSSRYGEGYELLGTAQADGAGAFILEVTASLDHQLTATATDSTGNTSEFCRNYTVQAGSPDIDVPVTAHDFGNVGAGDSLAWQWLWIRNAGSAPLGVDRITLTGPFAADDGALPATLAPGDSMGVTVTFKPDTLGAAAGTLVVRSGDPDEAAVAVYLTGTGSDVSVADAYRPAPLRTVTLAGDAVCAAGAPVTFRYGLPRSGYASVRVYDAGGILSATPATGVHAAGYHACRVVLNAPGMYIVTLTSGMVTRSLKVLCY